MNISYSFLLHFIANGDFKLLEVNSYYRNETCRTKLIKKGVACMSLTAILALLRGEQFRQGRKDVR